MSGPVQAKDVTEDPRHPEAADGVPGPPPELEVTPSRTADVGGMTVRRALPRRTRRTVGAWCFADHMGPHRVSPGDGVDIGPHPHIGLHTVTWLVEGELLHRDSLGSEQPIRPGQLNLMTAGRGVSHAEESTSGYAGDVHGIQLWVAQPETTRHGEPAFEHHAELPRIDLDAGIGTVLVGELDGAASSARSDTDLLGVDLQLHGRSTLGLRSEREHALVVLDGAVTPVGHRQADQVDGPPEPVGPGHLVYLAPGHDELTLDPAGPTRLLLLGGEPFESKVLMWWNFVGRTRDEVEAAREDWQKGGERFGDPGSALERIGAPPVPWRPTT
jgi:redox-sensitive bicupin YhaK (pirin superfamily)